MAAPIKEVAADSSERNRAFIKHTLLYYINDIDSGKHNQPREPSSSGHCGCVPDCVRVYVFREHVHARAASAQRTFIRQQKRTISY